MIRATDSRASTAYRLWSIFTAVIAMAVNEAIRAIFHPPWWASLAAGAVVVGGWVAVWARGKKKDPEDESPEMGGNVAAENGTGLRPDSQTQSVQPTDEKTGSRPPARDLQT